MEKSFHPSTLHLVSDLIEIGSHDDSHRRNLASLETISLIAFALRIRTWETLLLLLLLLVFVHTPRRIIGGPNLHFPPPFPLSILFNRLRNSNVARLEFRLWCTAPPQLLSTAISPLARARALRWMRIHYSPGGYLFAAGLHPSRVYLSGFERSKGALQFVLQGRESPFHPIPGSRMNGKREGGIARRRSAVIA